MSRCRAGLVLRGEFYPCDTECVDEYGEPTQGHEGWAHGNREAQAVWVGPEERDRIEGQQDVMQEQEQEQSPSEVGELFAAIERVAEEHGWTTHVRHESRHMLTVALLQKERR